MHDNFKNKVAVITGGANGIGAETARLMSAYGAIVVVSDIQKDSGERLVDELKKKGSDAVFIKTDVSNPQEVKELFRKTIEQYSRVDFGINNAGVEGDMALTGECSIENWDRVIATNLKGVWLSMKEEIAIMTNQHSGIIVNTSSVMGLVGRSYIPAYVASKHGIIGLTKSAAIEYGSKGIRINAVCPGAIDTDMIQRVTHGDKNEREHFEKIAPMNRMGSPKEIANAILWLCSDQATFITGHALVADGGMLAG